MNERDLRSECRRLLRELDIRPPLDVTELAARIAAHRGRPIRLIAWPLNRFGYSFSWDEGSQHCDVIAFQKNAAKWHQDHIICHELAHIYCGHLEDPKFLDDGGEDDDETSDAADISADLPFSGVLRRLRRTCYDSPEERLVELMATTLMEWAVVPGCAPQPSPTGAVGDAVGTLYESLSYRRGWL